MPVIYLCEDKSSGGTEHVKLERSTDKYTGLCMMHTLQYCLNYELFSCCYNHILWFTDISCSENMLKILRGLCFPTPFCLIEACLWAGAPNCSTTKYIGHVLWMCSWVGFFALHLKVFFKEALVFLLHPYEAFPRTVFKRTNYFSVNIETILIHTLWSGACPFLPERSHLEIFTSWFQCAPSVLIVLEETRQLISQNLPSFLLNGKTGICYPLRSLDFCVCLKILL